MNLKRLFIILSLAITLTGCSISFAYRYAGFLVMWEVTDYISLTREQKKNLKADINTFAQWHLKNELPFYRATLVDINTLIDQPSPEGINNTLKQLNTFWPRSINQFLPLLMKYQTAFTDQQIAELINNLEDDWAKDWEKIVEQSEEELFEKSIKRRAKRLTKWFGTLSHGQQKFITQWQQKYTSMEFTDAKFSQLWLKQLRIVLIQRHSSETFIADMQRLLTDFDYFKSPEHIAASKANRDYYVQFMTAFLLSLTDKQRQHAHDEIAELIAELDDAMDDE